MCRNANGCKKLHTFGLLNQAFRPAEEIGVLRSYLQQRENLVAAAAMCVQHMQKALTEMNIQLANVISDISGTTGMAVLRDIVRGERDPTTQARAHSRQSPGDCPQPGRNVARGVAIRYGAKPGTL
jgi:hypothetical protein